MWDGSHAFVPNLDAGTVSVIDLLNMETDATVDVCPGPPGGALTPDQVTYIVACGGSDELAFVNTASFEVTGRVTGLGPRPFSVAVPGQGRYAVVNNAGGNTVSVVDVESETVVQTIEVGEQPIVVRVHPDGERVFVANEVSGTLVELIPGDEGTTVAAGAETEATQTPDGAAPTPGDDPSGPDRRLPHPQRSRRHRHDSRRPYQQRPRSAWRSSATSSARSTPTTG